MKESYPDGIPPPYVVPDAQSKKGLHFVCTIVLIFPQSIRKTTSTLTLRLWLFGDFQGFDFGLSRLSRLLLFGLLLFGDFGAFTFDLLLLILYFFTFRTFKSFSSCSVIRYESSENKLVFKIK